MKLSKLAYLVVMGVVLSACGGGGADAGPDAAADSVRNTSPAPGGGSGIDAGFNALLWGATPCTSGPIPKCPPPMSLPSSSTAVPLRYEITYTPYDAAKGVPPSIAVAAPTPRRPSDPLYISPVTRLQSVEVLPFGMESQTLADVNASRGEIGLPTYLFELPLAFDSDPYTCGTGRYLSEVRITQGDGQIASTTFEICPGTPFSLTVTVP